MNMRQESMVARRVLREMRVRAAMRTFNEAYLGDEAYLGEDEGFTPPASKALGQYRMQGEDEAYLDEAKRLGYSVKTDEAGRRVLRHAKLPGHKITVHADETYHHTDEDEAVVRKGHVRELGKYAKALVGRAAESFRRAYAED